MSRGRAARDLRQIVLVAAGLVMLDTVLAGARLALWLLAHALIVAALAAVLALAARAGIRRRRGTVRPAGHELAALRSECQALRRQLAECEAAMAAQETGDEL